MKHFIGVRLENVEFLRRRPDVVEDYGLLSREDRISELQIVHQMTLQTLSALPVTRRCSLAGLKATDIISWS